MKERPILFSGAMVRAILEGKKTQTRRVCKFALPPGRFADSAVMRMFGGCPYGQAGDRLWVRETWASMAENNMCHVADDEYVYRATSPEFGETFEGWRWRPSIHMPRAVSRITLEITGVRAERVQEISEEDAQAEGCAGVAYSGPDGGDGVLPSWEYRQLWDSINGKRGFGWDVNPWVWVIEFRRIANA